MLRKPNESQGTLRRQRQRWSIAVHQTPLRPASNLYPIVSITQIDHLETIKTTPIKITTTTIELTNRCLWRLCVSPISVAILHATMCQTINNSEFVWIWKSNNNYFERFFFVIYFEWFLALFATAIIFVIFIIFATNLLNYNFFLKKKNWTTIQHLQLEIVTLTMNCQPNPRE